MNQENHTLEEFYGYGKANLNFREIGELCGKNSIGISQLLHRRPKLREAYEKGKLGIRFEDDLDTTGMIKSLVEPETQIDADAEELKVRVREALRLQIFFCNSIADFIVADRRDVYVALTEMCNTGELIRQDGSIVSYRFSGDDLPSVPLSMRNISNREKVLKVVAEGNHLSRQIIAATGLSGGEVTRELEKIETAQNEREVEKILLVVRVEPTFRAYFTPENAPDERDKLVLENGGVKRIEFNERQISKEIWAEKQREVAERNKNPKPFIPAKTIAPEKDEEEEILIKKEKTMDTTKQTTKEKMYAANLEGLAAQGLTQRQAADSIDVHPGSFGSYLSTEIGLNRAWKRGVEKFKSGASAEATTTETGKIAYSEISITPEDDEAFKLIENAIESGKSSEIENFKPQNKRSKYTPEMWRSWGAEGLTINGIARRLGATYGAVYQAFSKSEYSSAYRDGLAEHQAAQIKQLVDARQTATEKPVFPVQSYPTGVIAPKSKRQLEATDRISETRIFTAEEIEIPQTAKGGHPETKGFSGCAECGEPFSMFPKHVNRDGTASCDNCSNNEVQIEPRFEHTLAHISENGRSAEGIEQKKQEFLDSLPKAEIPLILPIRRSPLAPRHFKNVELEDGANISVGSDFNFFDASKRDREFAGKLADLMQEYETETTI